ncbi:hypothetical protein SAMN02799631_01452 [Methylobacterium sp. 174MFSha1.1]|uniref:hypothetical protein n=1 Tax=Methylobacterium sp. 174MFSha1.1 TaxID=1502749 RepID=UPI0008E5B509|nr:hypothetical protein [Methylobacterium sp. 174MFSha1.1]SFU61051.1 hypothetical protein SAMN02799631_01452 [Methylobacterium sp. 174MFSha1.1]
MSIQHLLCAIAVIGTTSACSHYPLPQDITGVDTDDIVANVRCQARSAVRQTTIEEFRSYGNIPITAKYTGVELADAFDRDDVRFGNFDFNSITEKKLMDRLQYYRSTQVTYEFTLRMQENNIQGANIGLINQFIRRADTISLGGAADRTRENSRIFILQDSFETLATKIKALYCDPKPGINILYPAVGRMPIRDLVSTYIKLNQWTELRAKTGSGIQGTKTAPAIREMADTITFTTKISGKANAGIAYNPVGLGFGASSIGFTNENFREDQHKVIVTLTTTDVTLKDGNRRAIPPSETARLLSGTQSIEAANVRNAQNNIADIARELNKSNTQRFILGF